MHMRKQIQIARLIAAVLFALFIAAVMAANAPIVGADEPLPPIRSAEYTLENMGPSYGGVGNDTDWYIFLVGKGPAGRLVLNKTKGGWIVVECTDVPREERDGSMYDYCPLALASTRILNGGELPEWYGWMADYGRWLQHWANAFDDSAPSAEPQMPPMPMYSVYIPAVVR